MATYYSHRLAPKPDNEDVRLFELKKLDFLRDDKAEPALHQAIDLMCDLARTITGAPHALVSLVFGDEQVFIGRSNVPYVKMSRELGLSGSVIMSSEPLVVTDLAADPRFSANPFVQSDRLRGYAGIPIEWAPGVRLGALSVFHLEPREYQPHEVVALQQITQLVAAKLRTTLLVRELRAQGAILRQTEALAQVGSWEVDVSTNHLTWSEQMYHLHEIEPGAEVTSDMIDSLYTGETGEQLTSAIVTLVQAGTGRHEQEVSFYTARGNLRHAIFVAEVEVEDAQIRVFGTMQDITEHRETEAKLAVASFYDPLTGLPNRTMFERRLGEALGEAVGPAAVVVVSLDGLQSVQDLRGRDVGNRILRDTAYRLVASVGQSNFVARLGDYEFGVYLHDAADRQVTESYRSALVRAFEEPFRGLGFEVILGASMGIAAALTGDEAGAVVTSAEIALRQAKLAGPSGAEYFAPELRRHRQEEATLLEEIRAGIARNEFVLFYQPICDVTGRARGFEALMRWQHPTRGLLTPYHFLAGFSDPVLSVALGDVALREAVKQMRTWRNARLDFGYVSVNLSTAQFSKPDFVAEVASLLRVHGIRPNNLVLEVTETVYLDAHSEQILAVLRAFRQSGVSLALDDFGTGHASLTHLKQFPIDRIKIDQTFVRELGQNAGDAEIVRAIVSLGQSLGMQVIAEGVETAAQLAFLQGLGCDRIQGYFFARPMPATEAATFCSQGPRLVRADGSDAPPSLRFSVPKSEPMISSRIAPTSSRPFSVRRSHSTPPP